MLLQWCAFGRLGRVHEKAFLVVEVADVVLSGRLRLVLFDESGEVRGTFLIQLNCFALHSLRLLDLV